jgi:hypothetical protein
VPSPLGIAGRYQDQPLGAAKITFATLDPYKADSPLLESGLLGPVRILTSRLGDTPSRPTIVGADAP